MSFEINPAEPICLEFVNTLRSRGTLDIETLRSTPDVVSWISAARVVQDLRRIEAEDLTRVHDVREASYAVLRWVIDGVPLPAPDRTLINSTAAVPGPRLALVGSAVERSGNLPSELAYLAVDLLELVDGPERQRLRWCADPECRQPFLDQSRTNNRRWCAKPCRERASASNYRERQRPVHGRA